MRKLSKILLATFALYVPVQAAPAFAEPEYTGRVNHVFDASTIRVAYQKGGQIRVKLAAIDGPNTEQAKAALVERLLGKEVQVRNLGWKDGYLIGQVLVDGKRICGETSRDGEAKLTD